MKALAFGCCLYQLQERTMTLGRGGLGALQLVDKWGWRIETFLLLSACMKDFDLGARRRSRGLGPMRRPWQAVVLCFGRVHFRQALAEGRLAGQLFIATTLWLFLLRGLPQC
jgi:hypothetical protein